MKAPVIVFVYNRPEHTKKTIESLSKNIFAKETDVFIFSDNAKNNKTRENVELVRKYIFELSGKNLFNSVHIELSEINKGLANSVIYGVSKILLKYGKAIVLEDDLITSIDFLKFMNDALDFYENHESIWSISGYNLPIKIPKNYKDDIYLSYRGCSWGWATWLDRWNRVDWQVNDYSEFSKNIFKRISFNRGGRDLSHMLDDQMKGKIDSWAIRWCYSQFNLKKYTIYPVVSKIRNIGLDGSGTHSGETNKFSSQLSNENIITKFNNVNFNKEIINNFKNQYVGKFEYLVICLKRFIKKYIY